VDQTETAEAVMSRHHPRRWLAAVRILRCARRCGRWPCAHWRTADKQRRRVEAEMAEQRIADMIGRPRGLAA
jgi:hypothetical protein